MRYFNWDNVLRVVEATPEPVRQERLEDQLAAMEQGFMRRGRREAARPSRTDEMSDEELALRLGVDADRIQQIEGSVPRARQRKLEHVRQQAQERRDRRRRGGGTSAPAS